jgi:hypothetical protein
MGFASRRLGEYVIRIGIIRLCQLAECDEISNLNLIEDLYKILLSIESEVFGA